MANDILRILIAELNTGNVAYGNRDASHPFNNDAGDVFGTVEFAHGSSNITTLAFIKIPGTDIFVFCIQCTHEFGDSDVAGRKRV